MCKRRRVEHVNVGSRSHRLEFHFGRHIRVWITKRDVSVEAIVS